MHCQSSLATITAGTTLTAYLMSGGARSYEATATQ
eukprot:SAG25_NODE_10271_length_340_cov_1.004149_1_plen_34_part_10